MIKILKYSIFDLLRSKWTYGYFLFFLIFTSSLFFLNSDLSKVIISLLNVILILCPLISTIFAVMYFYNSKDFTELLLAQPIKRSRIFLGQYFGLSLSLSISIALGIGIPFLLYGIFISEELWNFFNLIVLAIFLSFIFSSLAFLIALKSDNRIKGFGLAILVWLLFAIIYDGVFLILLMTYNDYPLEFFSIFASMLNPIDLARTLILLKLDISALMGYTGAVFKKFFGANLGLFSSYLLLIAWTVIPIYFIKRVSAKKDF